MKPEHIAPYSDEAPDEKTDKISGFFGKLNGRKAKPVATPVPTMKTKEALLLLKNYEDSGNGWFWSTNSSGEITYLTESLCLIYGKHPADLISTPFVDLFYPNRDTSSQQRTLSFVLTKQTKFDEMPLQAAIMGEMTWWAVSGSPQFDAAGNFAGYRGYAKDVTVQKKAEADTSKLVLYDTLTDLSNRFSITKSLESTLSAYSVQKRSCAIMLIDLDRFKQVNDTLGHPAGDALLKQVSERLLKIVGDRNKIGRLGGDEFKIILPDVEDRGALGDMATNIIASLSQPYSINGSRCIIGASIGVAVSPFDGESSDELIRNADLALYGAKANGRGRFCFYSRELLQAAEDRRALEEDLRDALTNDEISLHYQPIVNAATNCVTGFEALIRWHHPERGPISPALFIPIAEEANLIAPLGEWALRKACADAAKWDGDLRVAVNVSPIQFANEALPSIVRRALDDAGLSADKLELEITEGVFLADSPETDAMFVALKKIGVRLALDDFGTGYSSLSYLQTAPFDKIKIDQSFVRDATIPGSRNGAIIAAIVALAKALDMDTTAEGIETHDQLDLVRELGVSHIQGYIYSKPVRNEDVCEQISDGSWMIVPAGPAKQRNDRQSTFRKVGAIHENHCYSVVMRNISETGAFIEGLVQVPVGTKFVIDFGEGQLAVSTVRRSQNHQQGIEFEQRLVSDGNGGLCTPYRVSPYLIAAAAMNIPNLPSVQHNAVAATSGPIAQSTLPAFNSVTDWQAAEKG